MRDVTYLIGRILLSLVFLSNGISHLTHTDGSAQYAAYKKVPNARLLVQLTGALMVLGGLALVLGVWLDLVGLCLAVLVLIFAFVMHRFWEETDPTTQAGERAQFMKNVAIAGAGLILAAVGLYGPYTITDGVFK